jgi:hypothetical protein
MHLFAKLDGILPRNLLDWVHRAIALADYSLLKITWMISPHHFLVLSLGDFRHTKVVVFTDGYFMLQLAPCEDFQVLRQTHLERTLGNEHQFHPDAVGDLFGGLSEYPTSQLDHSQNHQ